MQEISRSSWPAKRALSALAIAATVATSVLVASQPAQAAVDGVLSVTPITEVSTYGQRVTAVAVEYDGTVDPASLSVDGFTVEDTSYNFRFDTIAALTNMVERDITAAYTNSEAGLREDGTSMEGSYVILELSDESPGGWTVRTSTSTSYVRINPSQPTRVFQLEDVLDTEGNVLSTARPTYAWTLTEPAVNLEVDEFVREVFPATTGNVPYDYRLPDDYNPANSYPMVVILPGYGMGFDGVNDRVEIVADIPATAWFQEEWTGTDEDVIVLAIQSPRVGDAREANEAAQLIDNFKTRFSVDPDRVYTTSVSWGSRTTWQLLSQRPDLFAGALVTGGFAPNATLRNAIVAAEIPIWITHGTSDHLGSIASARSNYANFVAAYRAAGLSESAIGNLIKFTEWQNDAFSIPDYHASYGPTYEDETILQWLLAQNKSVDLSEVTDIAVSAGVEDAGVLALSLESSAVDMGTLELAEDLMSLDAQADLPTVTVADTRSGNPGWALTLASSDFRSVFGHVIGAEYLGLLPEVLSTVEGQTVTAGEDVAPGTGFAGGTALGSAQAGEGRGTATLGGTLVLEAPTSSHEGDYVARIAVTLL